MTKRERVTAAMNNRPVDRPPVGFWFHFPPEKALGQPCIDAHLAYYNNIGVDIAKLMCDGYFDYPNPVAKAAKEPGDWYALKPLGPDSPFIREQVERARAIKQGLTIAGAQPAQQPFVGRPLKVLAGELIQKAVARRCV